MRRLFPRLLAAACGIWMALGMGRAALGISQELRRAEALEQAISRTEDRIAALSEPQAMTDAEVRLWAFRQAGLTAPEDVVFFDGGAMLPEK